MTETLKLTVTDDETGDEPENVVLTVNDTPVASTMDEGDDTVEITPSMRMGIGPAQLEADDFAQSWVRVADGDTFNLLAWGLLDSNEESPDGFELVVMDSGEEITADNGINWNEPDNPIASVAGPANVFVQLVNNTGDDITASSTAQDWVAANFDFEVE